MSKISLGQQIEEVDYELGQRAKVYPRLAAKEPGRRSELDYHVRRMQAARATLAWLQENEEAIRAWVEAQRNGAKKISSAT